MTYISYLEQEFVLRNKEESPEYYLGTNLKRILNKYIHVSSSKYITEFLSNYEKKYGSLRKFNTPMSKDEHPELDNSDFYRNQELININRSLAYFNGFWFVVGSTSDTQLVP